MIETNLAAAGFVLLLLVIRRCFWKKLGWKYLYALWLLIPLHLFIFPFIRVVLPFGQTVWIEDVRYVASITELSWKNSTLMEIPIDSILFAVWLLGAFAVMAYFMKKVWKTYYFIKKYSKPADEWENGLRVSLFDSEDVAFLFAGTVYVSESIYKNKEWMNYVMLHEMEHKKQMDSFWNVVRTISLCFFWYNPFVWIACFISKRDSEFSCDERVTEHFSEEECRRYCKTLLEIATKRTYESSDINCGLEMTGGELKARIVTLCSKYTYRGSWRIGVTAMVLFLLAITLQSNGSGRIKTQDDDYIIYQGHEQSQVFSGNLHDEYTVKITPTPEPELKNSNVR